MSGFDLGDYVPVAERGPASGRVIPELSSKQVQRFWRSVDKGTDDECWNWTGVCGHKGHGHFNAFKKTWMAHRVSYRLLVGPIPEGHTLDHLCRNTSCVNPAHLEPAKRAKR